MLDRAGETEPIAALLAEGTPDAAARLRDLAETTTDKETRKAARRGATGKSGGSGAPGPSRAGSGSRSQPGSGHESRPQAARDPDDLAAEESATGQDARPPAGAPGTESLSGLDLIQRELGGKIIEEFGSD